MNKPTKIRAICAELRASLGNQATALEILECAQLVLGNLDDNAPIDRSFSEGRATIHQLPLGEVFENKSWQLFYKEPIKIFEDDSSEPANEYLCEQLGMTDMRMCA
jgi:hypothetical protein